MVASPEDKRNTPALQLTLRNHVIIPNEILPKKLTDFLKDELNFVNSRYIINQRLGKSNYKTERYFKAITHDDRSIMVPRGFLNRLTQFLDENEINFLICDERQNLDSVDLERTYKLFLHQAKALQHFEDAEGGILVAPPGSGKTIMGLELIARKKQPALIIAHRKQIFKQWIERIEDFLNIPKKHIGQFSGSKKKIQTPITISMIQSLSRCEELNEIGQNFGMVLVDECHHIPAKMFRHVITQLKPYYLFGLTATPKRKNNDERLIFIYLGDIVYEVPKDYNHEIFSRKHELMIHIRNTDFSMPFQVKTDDFPLLSKGLIFDRARNELIVQDISKYAKLGYKCLILTERKEHVDVLNLYLKRNFEVIIYTGDLGARKRKEVEKQIHLGHFQILIATGQLIGEGTDFPNLDCLFLVYPFSFEGKLVQYIGRIEHGKLEAKNQGRFIFDYRDRKVSVLEKQFKHRNRYYKKLRHAVVLQE
jgi:superfamily II DNA or RNA helicase